MPKAHKKAAPKPARRPQSDYGEGLVRLAVQISGLSMSTFYKVLQGKGVSAPATKALKAARRKLARQRGGAAA